MEQQFQLKYYGNLTLFEQNQMPAEDRAWWVERIHRELKETSDKQNQQMPSMRMPKK